MQIYVFFDFHKGKENIFFEQNVVPILDTHSIFSKKCVYVSLNRKAQHIDCQ